MKMNVTVRVRVPADVKEKFWQLSKERGLVPSKVLRKAMVKIIYRFEADAKHKKGGRPL